ncbi:hypothetical protein [Arenibaculum sp.]|jgi:hypothetical protein|uniref:hypothetical protein n=1 Tax=Arenibaculum sp. TaxID=2865862 RepID=UPI002E0D8334|nr:hypothetical protein [Arenibaculum sp.]
MAEEDRHIRERPVDASSRGPVVSGERARQGRIVLNTPARRWIFATGLLVLVVVVILFGW